ncbi:MAG: hypothetical protein FWD01_03375 [Defluviitaleaceae bacterium]|nr:hypothetical protein [Defluviitaleaceae bacterium]
MTLKQLEQIIFVRSEIDVLNRRLRKKELNGNEVDEIRNIIESRKRILEGKLLEAEKFISEITDSKIRTLLTLRFLEGEYWEDVGKNVHWKISGDAARKSVMRFFGKDLECP